MTIQKEVFPVRYVFEVKFCFSQHVICFKIKNKRYSSQRVIYTYTYHVFLKTFLFVFNDPKKPIHVVKCWPPTSRLLRSRGTRRVIDLTIRNLSSLVTTLYTLHYRISTKNAFRPLHTFKAKIPHHAVVHEVILCCSNTINHYYIPQYR